MTVGTSIFVIAVGAILYFATNFHVAGVDIDTVGVILMIAGGVGLLLGLFLMANSRSGRREVYAEERRDPPAY
jgi:hypothetical protein